MSKSIRNLIIGLVVFVICSAVLGILCYLELDQQATLQVQIDSLQPDIDRYNAKIATRERIAREKDAVEQHFANFVAYLPAKDDLDEHKLPKLIDEFLDQSGCTATNVSYSEGSKDLIQGGYTDFSRKVVNISDLRGNFNQVRDLMDFIETYKQLLRIEKFSMDPIGGTPLIEEQTALRVSLTISLYYYDKKS